MKKFIFFFALLVLSVILVQSQLYHPIPQTILPLEIMEEIIHEASGDLALQNEIFLTGVNRNRPAEEYLEGYFETKFVMEKLKEYGVDEATVIEIPKSYLRSDKTWDAEMGELWIIEPEKRKLVDLKEIATSVSGGSSTSDVTAELIYVGPGRREIDYEGKEVRDKIVLVNGHPEGARKLAVEKFQAAGIVAFSSSHPEFDRDQVGWHSIRSSDTEKHTFAFMISSRMGYYLRDLLEQKKVVLRAVCKTQMVPYRSEMISALIKGTEHPEEELVFTAHLFEGFAKQGANDNGSGSVAILETARVIKKLIREGIIPPPKRSIRFLFIPEFLGTMAFIEQYPEIAKRFYANINEDMVGEALIKNNAFFCLKSTPWSLPSYLNDILASLIEWVGKTNRITIESRGMIKPIVSPTGSRDPFLYSIDRYFGASDHAVFVDGGVRVPAVMFNVWPDMWYHTSGDLPDKSDSTQLKRVVVISVAAAIFLSNTGPVEIEKMIAEISGRGLSRLGEDKLRAEKMILLGEKGKIHSSFREAMNIMDQSIKREKQTLFSVEFFIKGNIEFKNLLKARVRSLESINKLYSQELRHLYSLRCQRDNIKSRKIKPTKYEIQLSKLVPIRTKEMEGYFDGRKLREIIKDREAWGALRLGRAGSEVRNFIDGKRSILEIRNAASAEYSPVPLKSVENFIKLLEKAGYVRIEKR